MSELTGLGSVEAGNPNGGNGTEQNGSSSNAAAPSNEGPGAGQPLDWAKAKGWVDDKGGLLSEKVAEGYQALEKRIGTMVAIPDEKAKPEDVAEFHKKLGWPGDPKGYEFNVPADLPKDVVYDQATADWFRETANELKLPKVAASQLHDKFIKRTVEAITKSHEAAATAFEAEVTQKATATHEALVKDWGAAGSPEYLQNRDAAVRAATAFPGAVEAFREAGLLTKENNFANPDVARMLATLGRTMQNDTFVGNGSGGGGDNPFAKASENATQQALLIKKDPEKARALAQAAGWQASDIRW